MRNDIRIANIEAALAMANAVRTSLGPRGMDKMVAQKDTEVIVTNDGATILKKMMVSHPISKMMVELANSQDVAAGDGTTTVTILCGALLRNSLKLFEKGIHPTINADSFNKASQLAIEYMEKTIGIPINLNDRETMINVATTTLGSKSVSCCSPMLSQIAVDCVLQVLNADHPEETDICDIKLIKKLGGTIEDSEIIHGLVLELNQSNKVIKPPHRIENAKICLAQFHISAPKTDIDSSLTISDYSQMDRLLKDERKYILQMVKTIKETGCNVILIQKSILRDSVSDLGEHYLSKSGILLVKDIERDNIEFISKTLGCAPIAHIQNLTKEKLANARLVEELQLGSNKVVKVTGIERPLKTATVLLRGSNMLILEEAERSLRDALCVVRCLAQKRFLVPGGSACETEVARYLVEISRSIKGMESCCILAFAEALEIVPYTLAENAGLDPIQLVTDLRARHAKGNKNDGINIQKGEITNMLRENVLQPLLVSSSAIDLASECARMILKIDDILKTP